MNTVNKTSLPIPSLDIEQYVGATKEQPKIAWVDGEHVLITRCERKANGYEVEVLYPTKQGF